MIIIQTQKSLCKRASISGSVRVGRESHRLVRHIFLIKSIMIIIERRVSIRSDPHNLFFCFWKNFANRNERGYKNQIQAVHSSILYEIQSIFLLKKTITRAHTELAKKYSQLEHSLLPNPEAPFPPVSLLKIVPPLCKRGLVLCTSFYIRIWQI